MTPHGQRHVDAARGDGRWAAAYAPIRAAEATIPEDLRAAIEARPRARNVLATLGRMKRLALTVQMNEMRTAAGRARKTAELVATLEKGEDEGAPHGPRKALSGSAVIGSG